MNRSSAVEARKYDDRKYHDDDERKNIAVITGAQLAWEYGISVKTLTSTIAAKSTIWQESAGESTGQSTVRREIQQQQRDFGSNRVKFRRSHVDPRGINSVEKLRAYNDNMMNKVGNMMKGDMANRMMGDNMTIEKQALEKSHPTPQVGWGGIRCRCDKLTIPGGVIR